MGKGGGGDTAIGSEYGTVSGFIFIFNLIVGAQSRSENAGPHLPNSTSASRIRRLPNGPPNAHGPPLPAGTGALALPRAMYDAGWVLSVVFLCVCCTAAFTTATFVVEVRARSPPAPPRSPPPRAFPPWFPPGRPAHSPGAGGSSGSGRRERRALPG